MFPFYWVRTGAGCLIYPLLRCGLGGAEKWCAERQTCFQQAGSSLRILERLLGSMLHPLRTAIPYALPSIWIIIFSTFDHSLILSFSCADEICFS